MDTHPNYALMIAKAEYAHLEPNHLETRKDGANLMATVRHMLGRLGIS